MKNIKLLTVIGILLCLLCVTIAAADNEDLPTREEVTELLEDSDSAEDVMESVKEDHPTWKADLIENGDEEAISLYYKDSDSSKGYGSIYFKDGEVVSPSSLSGYTLTECYKGELEDSDECTDGSCNTEPEDEENDTKDEEENDTDADSEEVTEEDSEYTYEALEEVLDDYDGTIDCSSKKCANALSDYLEDKGWTTEVEKKTFSSLSSGKTRYCVAVELDGEEDDTDIVYVVLGA